MNPSQAFANRTARLVAEAKRPVFSTDSESAERDRIIAKDAAKRDRLFEIEELACTDEFCHICSRATNHYSEHSEAQLFAWARQPGLLQSLLKD